MSDNWPDEFFNELNRRREARPTKQEWDGEGLPEVGVVCQCLFNDGWCKVAVLARHGSEFWVKRPRGTHIVSEGLGNKFRPLKSKQERQREELAALCDEYITRDDYGDNLADAVIKFYEERYNLEPKQ